MVLKARNSRGQSRYQPQEAANEEPHSLQDPWASQRAHLLAREVAFLALWPPIAHSFISTLEGVPWHVSQGWANIIITRIIHGNLSTILFFF